VRREELEASEKVIETHVSTVFVRERDVIKIKKPVHLGFLDFRSLAQRRAACEAEERLNARLAPDVYLGLVPIRDDGVIVDWGVRMRRLRDEDRADSLLEKGALGEEAIAAVARRIADFHRAARCDLHTARFGTPEVVRGNIEENFAQTKDAIERYLDRRQIREIVEWQTGFVERHRDLFAQRIRAGRVRDGHGDLRLEHVYLEPGGRITIIDCIEFNDRFRYADVCADVAFLSMDLAAHGRVDLSELFLSLYAREADDFDLYALVDFYESYRAFVRAKIATMIGDDAGARRHFVLALAAHRPALLSPSVVCVGGIIASGKSTIADRLGVEMSAPVIDADRTRKAMLGVPVTRHLDEAAWTGAYDPGVTDKVYAEVMRRAAVVLASGRPVILDASFRSASMRAAARELARRHGVPFRFVECRADPEVCRARVVGRARGVSDGRIEIFDAFRARFEPPDELDRSEHVVIDTGRPLAESISALRNVIATWPKGLVA
jgi:hypothetical protein